jgi:hypothetical protein
MRGSARHVLPAGKTSPTARAIRIVSPAAAATVPSHLLGDCASASAFSPAKSNFTRAPTIEATGDCCAPTAVARPSMESETTKTLRLARIIPPATHYCTGIDSLRAKHDSSSNAQVQRLGGGASFRRCQSQRHNSTIVGPIRVRSLSKRLSVRRDWCSPQNPNRSGANGLSTA